MDRVAHHGKNREQAASAISESKSTARRMRSFDRRIKDEYRDKYPDLEKSIPRYMRQTLSSLIKRSTFRGRELDEEEDMDSNARKGKKTTKKKSLTPREGHMLPRRRSRSKSSDGGRSFCSTSPLSELSIVDETKEDDTSSNAPSDQLSRKSEDTIARVDSLEPKIEGDEMSSLMEECFESVIQDALTSGRPSPCPVEEDTTRGASFEKTVPLEDAYSEVAADDSICAAYDSDDGAKSVEDVEALNAETLFKSEPERSQPPTPFTPRSEKLESETPDAAFDVLEEAKWLEDDEESVENAKLESHQLNDILASFSDSEFGDDYSQLLMDTKSAGPFANGGSNKLLTNGRDFNVRIPVQRSQSEAEADENNQVFEKCDSSKLADTDGSFQIRSHGLLWMLGGNLLAGVVGAAIASAGMPLSSHGTSAEADTEDHAPQTEGVLTDDWYFQAASGMRSGK